MFDADPRTMAAALIGYAFKKFPDEALDCDDATLALRLSAARMVVEFGAKVDPFGG